MLSKVISIQGLGLLHDSGSSGSFNESTLVFAENGRGKSTFTGLLETLRTGDVSRLARMRTIDGSSPTTAKILFNVGPNLSELDGGSWNHTRRELRVFDAQFVQRNVYSGTAVESDHRRNLLNFVLGDSAVAESARERAAAEKAAQLRSRIRSTEATLASSLHGMTLAEFIDFVDDGSLESEIQAADRVLNSQRQADELALAPVPTTVSRAQLDMAAALEILSRSLLDLQDSSQAKVEEHLRTVGAVGVEEWARAGLQYLHDNSCPFCGQSVDGLSLIGAYRQFFSGEYSAHLADIERAISAVDLAYGETASSALADSIQQQTHAVEYWRAHVSIEPLNIDTTELQRLLLSVRDILQSALAQKRNAPLSVFEASGSIADAQSKLDLLDSRLATLNQQLVSQAQLVGAKVAELGTLQVAELEQARERLNGRKERGTNAVDDLVVSLVQDRIDAGLAEQEAETSRDAVRGLMNATLAAYQGQINGLLSAFGATFSVQEMKTNFRGIAPQSEFVIRLRDKDVKLKSESGPDFDSALGEGDKRTLAFALFASSILADPGVGNLIVVLDDPMSSMDAGRRQATIQTLLKIQTASHQLVLCSHEPNFLREFRDQSLRQDSSRNSAEVELKIGPSGYTVWGSASLDELCESRALRLHRELADFVANGAGNPQSVAPNIRVVLEGYLHQRFPTQLSDRLMLGECISAIRQAVSGSALSYASGIVDEIEEINTYAGQFHHSGNPGYVQPLANAAEVQQFGQRALNVIWGKV